MLGNHMTNGKIQEKDDKATRKVTTTKDADWQRSRETNVLLFLKTMHNRQWRESENLTINTKLKNMYSLLIITPLK